MTGSTQPPRVVTFANTDRETWDRLMLSIPEASRYHSWDWLHYQSMFPGVEGFEGRLHLDDQGHAEAAVVMAITLGGDGPVLQFPGIGLPVPAVAGAAGREQRRLRAESD